jgi:hypothetical protein
MIERIAGAIILLLLLGGCGPAGDGNSAPPFSEVGESPGQDGSWSLQITGAGASLTLRDPTQGPILRLACVRDPVQMTLEVETFTAIGSEERLSFGADGEPFVFVADPMADRPGGVEATGPIERDLLARIEQAREISAIYGAQVLGPVAAPDRQTRQNFVAACRQIAERG